MLTVHLDPIKIVPLVASISNLINVSYDLVKDLRFGFGFDFRRKKRCLDHRQEEDRDQRGSR